MKLFLLNEKAVLIRGQNAQRVCVIQNGSQSKVGGVLTVGRHTITITEGVGIIPPLHCGSVSAAFTTDDGKTYDAGVVFFGHNGQSPTVTSHDALDAALTEATKIDYLTREIAKLSDAVAELRGMVEYKGLDCMFN